MHNEVLSDGFLLVEVTTTVQEGEPYDIQIQGSDRPYPAIVLRRRHRGKGATIKTISRTTLDGKPNPLYTDWEREIQTYLERRKARLDNRATALLRDGGAGGVVETRERWVDKTLQTVVSGRQDLEGNADSV